jgi:hypothetical protein
MKIKVKSLSSERKSTPWMRTAFGTSLLIPLVCETGGASLSLFYFFLLYPVLLNKSLLNFHLQVSFFVKPLKMLFIMDFKDHESQGNWDAE